MAIAIHAGRNNIPAATDYPTIQDGVRGVAFIETVVQSAAQGSKWLKFPR